MTETLVTSRISGLDHPRRPASRASTRCSLGGLVVLACVLAFAPCAITADDTAAEVQAPSIAQDAEAPLAPTPLPQERAPEATDAASAPAAASEDTDVPASEAATTPAAPSDEASEPPDSLADTDDDLDLADAFDGEEDILFQEIPSVYGVSKFEQKITEAPSFVTLITSDEIAKYGYKTLGEVLQSATGFFVTYDRNYNYLGVRGFNRPGDFNTRVLVLVDGHRANDNLYDQGGVGTESIVDVDLIDRVEVIRGPSSSLYGTNAFFGVINVITKRGRDIRGFEASGELGSFETYRTRATYGDKFSNGLELLLSASFYESAGQDFLYYPEFDDPLTNNGITEDADGDEFPHFTGKASWRGFTLQGGHVSREKEIPTAAYGTFFPTDATKSIDEHTYLFLKFDHQFDTQLNATGRVYYDRFYYQGDYLYNIGTDAAPDLLLNRDKSTGEWWGAEFTLDRRFLDRHNVTAGFEYRDNFRQDLWNADLNPDVVLLDDKRDSWFTGVFIQDEISILENLILNAGVRYDYYDSFGGTVNPRVALIYNLEKTTMKALFGRAFRGPNAYERHYEGSGFLANPSLDPEEITTYELVLEHSITPHIRATVAGYIYQIDDLISQQTEPGGIVFRNQGEIEAQGLELQLEMDDAGPLGISGRIGYALQQAKDKNTNRVLTNSPKHLVNLNASVPIYQDKLFGGFELLYGSDRKTLTRADADDFIVTNFTLLTRNLLGGLEVSASVRNVFDHKYSDPGSDQVRLDQIEQDGRSFWLKAKYGF